MTRERDNRDILAAKVPDDDGSPTPPGPCPSCGEHGFCDCEAGKASGVATYFEPNPDHVEAGGMRRSIHRSHRGEGFNHGVGE